MRYQRRYFQEVVGGSAGSFSTAAPIRRTVRSKPAGDRIG
jgi:hypothetical protein